MLSRDEGIEANICEAEVERKEALEAGCHDVVLYIDKRIELLQEDLRDERQHFLKTLAQKQGDLSILSIRRVAASNFSHHDTLWKYYSTIST
jgi:hypothetical protein